MLRPLHTLNMLKVYVTIDIYMHSIFSVLQIQDTKEVPPFQVPVKIGLIWQAHRSLGGSVQVQIAIPWSPQQIAIAREEIQIKGEEAKVQVNRR